MTKTFLNSVWNTVQSNLPQFFLVNAICGSGKTQAAISEIAANAHQKKFFYLIPSLKLSNEIAQSMLNHGIDVYRVDSETNPHKVIANITAAIRAINVAGSGVLLCTQQAFFCLPEYLSREMSGWTAIVDEVPKLIHSFEPTLPYNHHVLSDYIKLGATDDENELAFVVMSDKSKTEAFLRRNADDLDLPIKDLIKDLASPYRDVFTDLKAWNKVVVDKRITADHAEMKYGNEHNKLRFFSILSPRVFSGCDEVVLMGAHLNERSALVHVWQNSYGIKFKPHQILSRIDQTEHKNGNRLEIVVGQERDYSRYQSQQIDKETGLTATEIHINQARSVLDPDQNVLVLCNKADEEYCPKEWTKAPAISHGLNCFQDYNQFVFLASYGFSPKIHAMLVKFGIPEKILADELLIDAAYQALMRTSLRNPSSTAPVKAYIVSNTIATDITKDFIGSTIQLINGIKKKVIGVAGKTAAERRHQRVLGELVADYCRRLDLAGVALEGPISNIYKEKVTQELRGNAYRDLESQGIEFQLDPVKFGRVLERFYIHNVYSSKTSNILLNATVYTDTSRKSAAADLTTGIFLDIDGGSVSPEALRTVLADKLKISCIMHSSASHLINNEYRYRVFIPVNQPITAPVYDVVFDGLIKSLEDHHIYVAKKADSNKFLTRIRKIDPKAQLLGLDLSKKNLSSIFYAPGKLESNQKNAFFWKFYMTTRTFKRHVLKVDRFIQPVLQQAEKEAKEEAFEFELQFEEQPLEYDSGLFDFKLEQHKQKIFERIEHEIYPGNRSLPACSIAGSIKWWPDPVDKLEVLSRLQQKGCDRAAMKSAFIYSGLKSTGYNRLAL